MNNIPKLRFPEFKGEWEKKKLGDTSEINPNTSTLPEEFIYIDLDSVETGQLLKETKLYRDEAPSRAQRLLKSEDVLFQTVRPYQKNNYFFEKNGDYVASTGYAQIRPLQNPRYIYHYLHFQKFVDTVIERCTGTSYPSINSSDLANIQISYPSLPEQQKIASFFTVIDRKISLLKQQKSLLEQYKKGIMQKIFSQELRFRDDVGKEFPEWEEKELGEVAEVIMGQSPSSNSYNSEGFGKFLIQGNADIFNRISQPRNWTTEFTKECNKGDILLTVRAPVGAVAKSVHNACIGRGICAIRNNFLSINEYLFQYLLKYEVEWHKLEQGSTFTAVTVNDVRSLKIPLPSLLEQTKIANFLSALDDKIRLVQVKIEKMELWKKGLLQKMFC